MKLIDTHCHIYNDYYSNIDNVISNMKKNNIKYAINNGTNLNNCKEVLMLSKKYNELLPAIGFQPSDLENLEITDLKFIIDNINNVVAIGEIGLDYYNSKIDRNKQIEFFEEQLKIAEKYNKPVIIHSRNSFDDTIKILKRYKLKGVIHCFTGNIEEANKIIELGFKLGIGGILTFRNSELPDVIKRIDLKNIVLETDSPYLSPVPLRGKVNEPKNLIHIIDKISLITGKTVEEISEIINKNTKDIFDI